MSTTKTWPAAEFDKAKTWLIELPPVSFGLMLAVACIGPLAALVVNGMADRLDAATASPTAIALTASAAFWAMLLPPALAAGACAAMYLHERLPVAVAGLVCFALAAAWYCGFELLRLWPFLDRVGDSVFGLLPYMNPWVSAGAVCGGLAAMLTGRLSVGELGGIKRARRAELGDADWMTMPLAAKLFPTDGQIIIGERYRVDESRVRSTPFDTYKRQTWGPGGKAPLLTYKFEGSTHMIFFAGSGSGKTASAVLPTMLKYTGPVVVLDSANEIAPIVADYRRKMKRNVIILDPRQTVRDGFNALAWIETSKNPEEEIAAVAKMLLSEGKADSSTGSYFTDQAHNFLTGLLAHVMLDDEYKGKRTLRSLRELVSLPEPSILDKIRELQTASAHKFISGTLGVFSNMTEQTFSGVYSTASKDLQWLELDAYAEMVCGDTFSAADLVKGDTDVFICVPAKMLTAYRGIGRVIMSSLMNAMIQADGRYAQRVLFCLDEVDLLGTMGVLEEARDRGRKFGISLMMFYQSIGQMEKHFGKAGATSWIESAYLTSYAGVKALETAREVSAKCGEYTVEVRGNSKSVGSGASPLFAKGTESVSSQKRPLIAPHEILQTMRMDEQIILVAGQPPLRCGRAFYFRRAEMKDLIKPNRFIGGANMSPTAAARQEAATSTEDKHKPSIYLPSDLALLP